MERDDLDVSPFVAAMRQRGRPHKLVKLPGTTAKVGVWVPTASERAEADAAARTHLTKTLKLDALQLSLAQESELFERERDIELLARVLRDPRDPSQAFVDHADTIRDPSMGFTDYDRKLLIAAIDDFARERYEPNLPDDEEKIVELMLGLKDDGALSVHVGSFASDTLRSIVLSLVKAWPTPTSPSSSAT